MVVSVLRPPADFRPFAALSTDNQSSAMDILATVAGWRVEVGAVGNPTSCRATRPDRIATDARLLVGH